ncbi:hypothetical protein PMAYCL1PPCAC_17317, partial [Pristionchus mayeri]
STSSTASPSTTTTSTVSSTTTSACDDYNSNGICDVYENLRCEVAILTGTALTLAKIILLLSTIWVVIWSIATIVVNILHKNTGHHRWIHLVEELGIIILWIFMGVFNLTMRSNVIFCTIVSVVIHYFAVMIATCFVFEAIFANSMVHNKQKKNGAIPPLLNYIIPLLLALVPSLVTYFTNKKYYGISGLHCFVITELPIMYAFVIPVWALVTIALWPSSLGNLACDVTSPEQDQRQCYWAKKSCKVLALLSFWFLFAYLTCMFGSNSQRLWVLILFLVQSLIFGPLLFIAHTFCHVNTSSKWYRPSLPGRLYTPCFSSRPLPFIPPLEMPKQPPSPVKRQEPPRDEPVKDPQQSPTTSDSIFDLPDRQPTRKMVPKNIAGDHMVASDLWGWASTKGKEDRREDVVMGLRP